jgi:3-dehydroquinate dehydratase
VTGQAERPLVLLVSGPNLDILGQREPEIYGTATLADHVDRAAATAARLGLSLEHRQSNHEGDLIEAVHGARGRAAAIVINAGALSHTSWSLHDALSAFDGVVVELHLSNPAGTPRSSPRWPTVWWPGSAGSATSWRSRRFAASSTAAPPLPRGSAGVRDRAG